MATRVFEVADGKVTVYPGNYEDYAWRKEGRIPDLDLSFASHAQNGHAREPELLAAPVPAVKRVNPIKLRKLQDRRDEIEGEVSRMEIEIARYEAELGNFVSIEETTRLTSLIERRRTDLTELLSEWEEVSQTLEAPQ